MLQGPLGGLMQEGMQALPKGKMGTCRSCVALTDGWSKCWPGSEGARGLSAGGCEYFQPGAMCWKWRPLGAFHEPAQSCVQAIMMFPSF